MIAEATRRHLILSRVLHHVKSGCPTNGTEPALQPYWSRRHELTVEQGCLIWGIRVIVPCSLQQQVLEELHHSHSGIERMKAVARSYVWWPGLDGDLVTLARSCKKCQSCQSMPAVAPLHPWLWPTQPWQRIHIDYAVSLLKVEYLSSTCSEVFADFQRQFSCSDNAHNKI